MHEPEPLIQPAPAQPAERHEDESFLTRYLARIGYDGPLVVDLATLTALQRHHLAAIPFENLDVLLGRPPGLERDEIFGKLVTMHRGGWCYEMNGVFGRMLEAIGFRVTRIAAGVLRSERGDAVLGNHLALIVHLDRDYLVDVGFGGSQSCPHPLEEGARDDGPFRLSLERVGDGYWRYTEHLDDRPFSFDFREALADEALLAHMNGKQFLDPQSPFVLNLVVQRRVGDLHLSLRGRLLRETTPGDSRSRLLNSAEELVATLRDTFRLDVPEAARLWPKIVNRHEVLFGSPEPA